MLGATSGGGKLHESWEFDSGARDLSPEPHTLQKLVEAAGGSLLTSGATGNMFDLANKVRFLYYSLSRGLRTEILIWWDVDVLQTAQCKILWFLPRRSFPQPWSSSWATVTALSL